MRFVDEFRDPEIIKKTADEIRRLTDPDRHYRVMTHSAQPLYPISTANLLVLSGITAHGLPGGIWICLLAMTSSTARTCPAPWPATILIRCPALTLADMIATEVTVSGVAA